MACIHGRRSGTGKTASAILLARGLAPDGIGYFVRVSELVSSLSETGWGHTSEQIQRARGARVLVLDDLGIEQASEASRAAVCDLVWRRADSDRAGRATIVTTSLSPDELTRRYGDGMTRRLHQLASVEIA
jgi:DNA replication protein DnaC